MPITGLTDTARAFMELGRIKKGQMQGNRPIDLNYFRTTFKEGAKKNDLEKAFRAAYGDQPTELNVRFAFNTIPEVWDANYECYKQGGLICTAGVNENGAYWIYYRDPETSEVLVRNGQAVGEAGRAFIQKAFTVDQPIYKNSKGEPVFMKPAGRLQVVIPELAPIAVGFFTFQPTSPRDIRNISAELGAFYAIAAQYGKTLAGVPFKLIRRQEEVTKNIDGKLSKGPSWVVHLEVQSGDWGRLALEAIEKLALPEVIDVESEDVEEEFPALEATTPAYVNQPDPIVEQPAPVKMINPYEGETLAWAMKELGKSKDMTLQLMGKHGGFSNPMPRNDFIEFVKGMKV